ncbi:carbohydrate ABC transporter permease [Inquilinus sp. CA228]|uniref:carbohydrate ABC transporter permease n=1 Tax=Inquilinus sp. CA228 TaxID=3455609 RepID=UPI003F8D7234
MRNSTSRQGWRHTGIGFALAAIVNIPVVLVVLNSLKPASQAQSSSRLLPDHIDFANYLFLIESTPFFTYLRNSLVIALGSAALCLPAAVLGGYALSRFRNRLLSGYSTALFAVQIFPIVLALIPLFILFREAGLIDTPVPVIIVYSVLSLPFVTWMARSYFDTIPRELEEAALMDGCGHFRAFWRVVLPLAGPGVAASAIFAFLMAYNEFFVANVFLRTRDVMTLPVGIQMFMQQFSTDWGSLTAAETLTMAPTLVLFLFVQRFITHGAVAGAVKG